LVGPFQNPCNIGAYMTPFYKAFQFLLVLFLRRRFFSNQCIGIQFVHLVAGAGPYLGIGIDGENKVSGRLITGMPEYGYEEDIEFSNDDATTTNEDEGAGFGILRRFDYGRKGTAGVESKMLVLNVNYG
jgi:hypothetical protein